MTIDVLNPRIPDYFNFNDPILSLMIWKQLEAEFDQAIEDDKEYYRLIMTKKLAKINEVLVAINEIDKNILSKNK